MGFMCKVGLHRWKYVLDTLPSGFLGKYRRFRICTECKKAQEERDNFYECYWESLGDEDRDRLLSLVEDKGDYYLFRGESDGKRRIKSCS